MSRRLVTYKVSCSFSSRQVYPVEIVIEASKRSPVIPIEVKKK